MHGHLILCGFGRVGRAIAHEFTDEGIPFVVVDSDDASLVQAVAEGAIVVHGNAADVETLKAAGVERARGLVTAVDNDADNLYVTLSARVLKPDLFIVARANAADAEPKLRLAGANRVVSPYTIGGRRLASLAMRPTAVEFVDTILSASNGQLLLEDLTIPADSSWAGRTLGELVPEADEAIVLAIKRAGTMIFRPLRRRRCSAETNSSPPARPTQSARWSSGSNLQPHAASGASPPTRKRGLVDDLDDVGCAGGNRLRSRAFEIERSGSRRNIDHAAEVRAGRLVEQRGMMVDGSVDGEHQFHETVASARREGQPDRVRYFERVVEGTAAEKAAVRW
jgi:voltage-gated potassium channel Kch